MFTFFNISPNILNIRNFSNFMDCLWISEILMDPKYDVYNQGNVEFCLKKLY